MEEVNPLKVIPGPDPNYNDICFGSAGRDVLLLSKFFPEVNMVYGNGQKISLTPENYLFRHTKVHGGYCLGIFQNGKDPTTRLGGIEVDDAALISINSKGTDVRVRHEKVIRVHRQREAESDDSP